MRIDFTPIKRQLLMIAFFISSTALIAQVPANNECSGAVDINSLFGQPAGMTQSSGLHDNTNATSEASDPANGFDCFGERNYSQTVPIIENTLWFTFTGDGNTYFIETNDCGSMNYIGSGDTQMAIYSGDCGSLTPVDCSEDGPNAAQGDFRAGLTLTTTMGTVYRIMIDGFNFQGGLSQGEYCLQVTQTLVTTCADIQAGDVTAANQIVCFNDTTEFTLENTVIPNATGPVTGFRWIITGGDVSNSPNPGADSTYLGAFGGSATPYTPAFINDGSQLPTNVFVYFTPVAYGDATDTVGNGFFESLDFSNGCLSVGQSVLVLLAGDNGPIVANPFSQAASSTMPFDGAAGVDITGGGTGLYNVAWNTGATTDTITGLAPGDYMVTITDAGDCVDPLVITITVEDSTTTSTFSPEFEAAVELFPNPAKSQTQLVYDFGETTDLSIRLTNLTGQVLREDRIDGALQGRHLLELDDLPSGIYLIQIRDDNNLLTKRLIVE